MPRVTQPALGYQQLTVSTTAVALTLPAGAQFAQVEAESAGIRWRDDGVNPTASVGMTLAAGESIWYDAGGLAAFRAIRSGGADAILNVSYYG